MFLAQNAEEKYKLEKAKEEEITIFVKITLKHVTIFHGINQKKDGKDEEDKENKKDKKNKEEKMPKEK